MSTGERLSNRKLHNCVWRIEIAIAEKNSSLHVRTREGMWLQDEAAAKRQSGWRSTEGKRASLKRTDKGKAPTV